MSMVNPFAMTANFGAYQAESVDFDGTNDYLTKDTALTAIADSKKGTLSFWWRMDGGDANYQEIITLKTQSGYTSSYYRIDVYRSASGVMRFLANNSSGTVILQIQTSTTFSTSATWHHFLASWDLSTAGARSIYVDDALDIFEVVFTNDTINYAGAAYNTVGSDQAFYLNDGCLFDLWFDPGTYFDFSVPSNRRLFIDASGNPANMGLTGNVPTGTAPLVFLSCTNDAAAATFATNKGTGGGFTVTGSLDLGSTTPTD